MTERRLEANRANARRSTGPRTPEGKAAVAGNALRHGLTAREALIEGEDPEAFAALAEGVYANLAPVGALEEALADRVAAALWRLRRCARVETALFEEERGTALFTHYFSTGTPIDRLLRYEGAIERSLYRALHELERLQARRGGEPVPIPLVVDVVAEGPGVGPGGFVSQPRSG